MKNKTLQLIIVLAFPLLSFSQVAPPSAADATRFTPGVADKEAKFPGGAEGWRRYVEANLKSQLASKYIKLKKEQQEATQTARVQFIVDKSGNISNVEVVNATEVHPKLAAEAVRVIKEGPKWQPAVQNGKNVLYQAVQYITFLVTRE
jgi:protein TonB